eukprot:GILK01012496.1.p1 GENE.GILK01012496.1~~GILK01012496.1.p1  ORF type:complete len:149 (+),score=14.17 GILK01012496.1:111-557(+)
MVARTFLLVVLLSFCCFASGKTVADSRAGTSMEAETTFLSRRARSMFTTFLSVDELGGCSAACDAHGMCEDGRCFCSNGWQGDNCDTPFQIEGRVHNAALFAILVVAFGLGAAFAYLLRWAYEHFFAEKEDMGKNVQKQEVWVIKGRK